MKERRFFALPFVGDEVSMMEGAGVAPASASTTAACKICTVVLSSFVLR